MWSRWPALQISHREGQGRDVVALVIGLLPVLPHSMSAVGSRVIGSVDLDDLAEGQGQHHRDDHGHGGHGGGDADGRGRWDRSRLQNSQVSKVHGGIRPVVGEAARWWWHGSCLCWGKGSVRSYGLMGQAGAGASLKPSISLAGEGGGTWSRI